LQSSEEITEKENTEEIITLNTELLIVKAGDSRISKTKQIKAQPERPAVEYRAAIPGSQEITVTTKDAQTAAATVDRLVAEGYLASINTDDREEIQHILNVSLELGKEILAKFRQDFKNTKHKDHGNKAAIEAGKAAKEATKAKATSEREREKELKAEAKRAEQGEKDRLAMDAIKHKERDRVLKENRAENQRLGIRIKQDEATLKAIKGLIKKRGYSSPEADEEIEQRTAALAADKETLATSRREIKKEIEPREKVVITEVTGTTEESSDLVGPHSEMEVFENKDPELVSGDDLDDLDEFGPTDGDFLAGM